VDRAVRRARRDGDRERAGARESRSVARATRATVRAGIDAGVLRLEVQNDGIGGAQPEGSGLLGLKDRLAVLDGRLVVENGAHGGTLVAAEIPLPG
jgi:signal transduction histidine kinase